MKLHINELVQKGYYMVASVWRWWVSELLDLLPQSWGKKLRDAGGEDIINVDMHDDRIWGDDTQKFIQKKAQSDVLKACVNLSKDDVYIDSFKLPLVARSKLKQAIEFEIIKRSPLLESDALYDYSVSQNSNENTYTVNWAIIHRDRVNLAQNALSRMGCFLVCVRRRAEQAGEHNYVFYRRRPPLRLTKSKSILMGSIIIYAVSVYFAQFVQESRYKAAENKADQIRQEALYSDKLHAAALQTISVINDIVKESKVTKASDIMHEVAILLPDDTWIVDFRLKGNQLQLVGYSKSAAELVERFSASRIFGKPHFLAPITPRGDKGGERFEIAMTVLKPTDNESH